MEYKEEKLNVSSLYPTLPTAPPVDEGQGYRLQKINEIQRTLEDEREKRQNLSKKYHRAVKVIGNVDTTLVAASMGLGVAGVGLLSTIVAAPIVIAMEATALGTGLLGIIGGQVNKRLIQKAEKHEKIKVLAEAKLNTISDLISKALNDNNISSEEYALILSELTKYRDMKEEVRTSTKKVIDDQTRESLINQGREEAIDSFQRVFNKSRSSFKKIIDNVQDERSEKVTSFQPAKQ